jgi:hypothetical protein
MGGYKEGGYQKSYMNNYSNRQYYDNANIGNRGGSGHIKSYQNNQSYGYSQQSSYDNQQQRRKSFKDNQQ